MTLVIVKYREQQAELVRFNPQEGETIMKRLYTVIALLLLASLLLAACGGGTTLSLIHISEPTRPY